ncbi:MAG TPA: RNA polymerase sigma factor [Herpetosiphonaceae bacterium]
MPSLNDPSPAIVRAREGQPQAIGELYGSYADPLFRYCYTRLHDREAAQDCVQEVFVCVWKGIKTFEYRGEISLIAWLYTIANNVVVSYIRKRQRTDSISLTISLPVADARSADLASAICDRLVIRQALAELTSEQQHVVTLKFFLGLSNREIAAVVRRSEGAVKALQYRALHRLYQILTNEQVSTIAEHGLTASA